MFEVEFPSLIPAETGYKCELGTILHTPMKHLIHFCIHFAGVKVLKA